MSNAIGECPQLHEAYQLVFAPINSKPEPPAAEAAETDRPVLSDGEILNRARTARNSEKFARLFAGDTSGHHDDDSAADEALCSIFAFWTRDPEQIDRLFRRSGLCRDKWTDRKDYRDRTIANALKLVTVTYGTPVDRAPALPEPMSVRALLNTYPALRPARIEGLLRVGETMNWIAPPKTGKSWGVLDLAINVALGQKWLGKFQTYQTDVLILDNELHPNTIADRIPKVAEARGVRLEEIAEHLYVVPLRGRLTDIDRLRAFFHGLALNRFGLIILDAFYRALPSNTDENSNADMANVYNTVDSYADKLGASFVLIHHASKGAQAGKAVTDVGSGAGAQSRAADCHLVMRAHEEDNVVVVEAAVRSFAPLAPICLRWNFPIWLPADDLDPTQLRQEKRRKKKDAESEAPKFIWNLDVFTNLVGAVPRTEARIVIEAQTLDSKVSERRIKTLLNAALDAGKLHRWTNPKDRTEKHKFSTVPQHPTQAA